MDQKTTNLLLYLAFLKMFVLIMFHWPKLHLYSRQQQVTPDMQSTTPFIDSHPTWRPRRENCSPPAIEQFPRPLMGPYARKHGGLLIHVLVAVYTFLGLAIVCDDYFVASLDRICEGEPFLSSWHIILYNVPIIDRCL